MYNKVVMLGNLTRDVELRYLPSGTAVAKSAIATSYKYKVNREQKEEVCFIDLTFMGRTAEIANQYLKKGSKVLIEGRLVFEQWTDQVSKGTRSRHILRVDEMKMLDSKNGTSEDSDYGSGYAEQNQARPQQKQMENKGGYSSNQYEQKATSNHTNPTNFNPKVVPEIEDIDDIPF